MTIELKLTLDISERLAEAVSQMAQAISGGKAQVTTKTRAVTAIEPAKGPEAPKLTEAPKEPKEAPKEPEPAPSPEPAKEPAKEPTLEDARAAISDARDRIIGPDWRAMEGSESHTRWYKAITAECTRIITQLSGGKTKRLPELPKEQLGAFIAEVSTMHVDGDQLSTTPPF